MDKDAPSRPQVLEHQGPYLKHHPVGFYAGISERAFSLFHSLTGGPTRTETDGIRFLATRLMYIAEITSTAVRLNGSWALTHAAMSLLRDRYEQTARFSWLARQTDYAELEKYLGTYFAKVAKIEATVPPEMRVHFDKGVAESDAWLSGTPCKEQREYWDRWTKLDLLSMVRKRDALKPLSDCRAGKQSLIAFYSSIYQQFSSVSHYDMYGVALLQLNKAPDGTVVLAPDRYWPAMLNLHNALFDIIQCHEACAAFYDVTDVSEFDALSEEWEKTVNMHMQAIEIVRSSEP